MLALQVDCKLGLDGWVRLRGLSRPPVMRRYKVIGLQACKSDFTTLCRVPLPWFMSGQHPHLGGFVQFGGQPADSLAAAVHLCRTLAC
jgi:hypothetical protein